MTAATSASELKEVAKAYLAYGRVAGAKSMGMNYNTFSSRVRKAEEAGLLQLQGFQKPKGKVLDSAPAPAAHVIDKLVKAKFDAEQERLRDQVRELKAQVESVKRETMDAEYIKSTIIGIRDSLDDVPSWVLRPMAKKHAGNVPTLFASDWHAGERVFPEQINGVNEFDLAIMERRARRMVEVATALLKHHLTSKAYPGIVLPLGGDMVTGDIHEELVNTNDSPTPVAVVRLWGTLVWCIKTLADEFGHVFVPCVTGNHGRLTKKMQNKNRNFTNWDWLVYMFLAKHFENDKRIVFNVARGIDVDWNVFGYRYHLEHGDNLGRGGDGIIGAIGPIIRGDHRNRSLATQINRAYDTMMVGHWHQLIQLQRVIVNGSGKGYDEYARSNKFPFEIPQQALWVTNAEQGISFQMAVHLETPRFDHAPNWIGFEA